MKILYVAFDINIHAINSSGVYKKIKGQRDAFKELGNTCELLIINNTEYLYINERNEEKIEILRDFTSLSGYYSGSYDFLYLRMGLGHKGFNEFIKRCSKNSIMAMEIPTYPFTKEMIQVAKSKWRKGEVRNSFSTIFATLLYRFVYFPKAMRRIDLLITISVPVKYKKNANICINNGIPSRSIEINYETKRHNDLEIRAVIVANLSIWHGVDRAIKGLEDYYSSSGRKKIFIDIVGDGEQKGELIRLTNDLSLQQYVLFHGRKEGKELQKIYRESDFAIGALAFHRTKCLHSSTLKSREYCINGIPMVLGETEEMYGFKNGIYSVACNEENLNFASILEWYESLDIDEVSDSLKNFAIHKLTWKNEMKKVIDKVQEMNV